MHIPTHILSGWCVGNLFPFRARERLFCMVAASAEDLDGLGIFISRELYWDYHHKFGHCIFFGVLMSAILTLFSQRKWVCFPLYLALFHLHVLLDYYGSGPGWPQYFFWPVSDWKLDNPGVWAFFSWQNIVAFLLLLTWALMIAAKQGRTPLELIAPRFDRGIVYAARSWLARLRRTRQPAA